jgi:hypothetical protein
MSDLTLEEFWKILHNVPESKTISFRLYYDELGAPIIYSMEELPGNYIEVDQSVYAVANFNVKVVDGTLIYIAPTITINKLQPSNNNGTPCDPRDVCVVVTLDQPHTLWSTTTNEVN